MRRAEFLGGAIGALSLWMWFMQGADAGGIDEPVAAAVESAIGKYPDSVVYEGVIDEARPVDLIENIVGRAFRIRIEHSDHDVKCADLVIPGGPYSDGTWLEVFDQPLLYPGDRILVVARPFHIARQSVSMDDCHEYRVAPGRATLWFAYAGPRGLEARHWGERLVGQRDYEIQDDGDLDAPVVRWTEEEVEVSRPRWDVAVSTAVLVEQQIRELLDTGEI